MNNRAIILARTNNGIVGKDNKLPWHIPEELKLFKSISSQYTNMVMGRNTFESLPGLLPNRQHIVLTTDKNYARQNIIIEHTVQDILDKYEVFIVIGGPKVWQQFIPYVDTIYLSMLHNECYGDAYYKESFDKFETMSLTTYEEFTHYVMARRV